MDDEEQYTVEELIQILRNEFDTAWTDINGYTAKDWQMIKEYCDEIYGIGYFKNSDGIVDDFKSIIAGFILWIHEGHGGINEEYIGPYH